MNKLGSYLSKKFTAQPEEPDDNDFEEELEPAEKLPHIFTVSDVQIQAVLREAKECAAVYGAAMLETLNMLGLPS